jgi:hypothetical protein
MRAFAIRIPRRCHRPLWQNSRVARAESRRSAVPLGRSAFLCSVRHKQHRLQAICQRKKYTRRQAAIRDDLALARSSLGDDFTVPRPLYCAFGCVLGGAVLDGAALGFALAFAFFFFFGAVSAPAVAGGAPVSCWALASDAVSSAAAGTASLVASPASKSTFRQACRSMLKFPN